MQRLEVSCAVRLIYVVRRQRVKDGGKGEKAALFLCFIMITTLKRSGYFMNHRV